MRLNVLVACEASQEVTKAFRELGHNAYSCDIEDCYGGHPEWHIKGDAIKTLISQKWDIVIAHPPCTYFANSGVRWLISNGEVNEARYEDMVESAKLFRRFLLYGKLGKRIAIENPIMHKHAKQEIFHGMEGKPSQIIQPWQFGHGETKATCLWLFGLPPLVPTDIVEEREQRVWRMPPGPERTKMRSKTFPGIAKAIAGQWSEYVINQLTQTK